MIGVGFIGATGYIGTPYREEVRSAPGARVVALCARRRELLERAGEEDGADLVTTDWREVVEHPGVDLVVVATPDALHREPVLACAAAGRHVLCEKPVGRDAAEAFELLSAYRGAETGGRGLLHYVPFWTRYHPLFERARARVAAGALGEVRAVVYRWHNPRPAGMPLTWRDDPALSSAGSIADVGSHAYDSVRWILGQEAVRVVGHAATLTPAKPDLGAINLSEALAAGGGADPGSGGARAGGTPDYASAAWEFEGGATGVIVLSHATYLRKGLAPELELHGTEASLALDRVAGHLVLARPEAAAPEVVETVPDTGFGNRFARHVFPALKAVRAGRASGHPDLEDGWRVQVFTDALALSARRGAWVELGEVAEASQAGEGVSNVTGPAGAGSSPPC